MRDAPDVPELQHDLAALRMHRLGHAAPARHLGLAVDARRVQVALALGADLGGLGHDEPGAGALAVIRRHQGRGDLMGARAVPGQRRHDDAVGALDFPQADGIE